MVPDKWQSIPLGELMIKGGGSVDPSKYKSEIFDLYSIPAYDSQRPETLKGSEIGSTKKVVQENDILLSRIVPHIQRCWIVGASEKKKRQIGSGEWIIFRGLGIDPKFIRLFLLSYGFHKKFMTTISGVGGSLTRANPNQVAEFPLPLPPLPEQHRIVAKIEELFSELDRGVQALQTAKTQLKTYRQAVLKHAFEGKLTVDWRRNNVPTAVGTGHARSGQTRNENESLPEGWEWKNIQSVVDQLDQGWSPKCERVASTSQNDWAVIKTTAIQHNYFNEVENKQLPKSLKPRMQHELVEDDILITRAGPRIRVGVCCLVKKVRKKLLNCDKAYRIKVNKEIILPEYLVNVLNSPIFLKIIETHKSGISDSGVNLRQQGFLIIDIPIPSTLAEQSAIVAEIESRLSVCDKLEATIEQSLAQAESLRQSILKKAFEGKLVPQDPEDEPAGKLLERIKKEREIESEKSHAAPARSGESIERKGASPVRNGHARSVQAHSKQAQAPLSPKKAPKKKKESK